MDVAAVLTLFALLLVMPVHYNLTLQHVNLTLALSICMPSSNSTTLQVAFLDSKAMWCADQQYGHRPSCKADTHCRAW